MGVELIVAYCAHCGHELSAQAAVCLGCGAPAGPLPQAVGPVSDKEWLVAVLLCKFLGFVGAHRFYTGHTGIAILQVLTLGGCLIWWIVDFVLVLTGGLKDAQGLPLKR